MQNEMGAKKRYQVGRFLMGAIESDEQGLAIESRNAYGIEMSNLQESQEFSLLCTTKLKKERVRSPRGRRREKKEWAKVNKRKTIVDRIFFWFYSILLVGGASTAYYFWPKPTPTNNLIPFIAEKSYSIIPPLPNLGLNNLWDWVKFLGLSTILAIIFYPCCSH